MSNKEKFLAKALKMSPTDRADIVDRLLQSLDKPDKEIDQLWKKEAESRITAYESGEIETVSLHEVIEKYRKA